MTTRRLVPGLLALATAGALTACGAGLDAMTYQERNLAEATDASTGALAVRNVMVQAPPSGELYEPGEHATVVLTVTNSADQEDRLVEVTTPVASEVIIRAGGREQGVSVPPYGSTGGEITLELVGLTRALRPGEYVDLTLRFEENGTVDVRAPVATTGKTDRPVYTGDREGGGHEPALQGPAGGDHGEGGSDH